MIIGIPREIMEQEKRVAVTPEICTKYIEDGHRVLVETKAGEGAFFIDEEYIAAGAEIVMDVVSLYERSDLILKVKEPQFNNEIGKHEIELMHSGQYLITFIHPAAPVNRQMVREMADRGIIGLTLDGVPRISRAQSMDALTSMSTCAGYKGILIGSNLLPCFTPQIISAVGVINPINTLVVGVGVGGLQAIATAKRLGSRIFAADIRSAAREQAISLGAKIIELGIPDDVAVATGGYAQSLSAESLAAEQKALAEKIPEMDMVFLSALVFGKRAPLLITEEMVKTMKPGSVIIDISIDQGGNCELTSPGKTKIVHNVQIVGINNIPGLLPKSSTRMFAQNVYNLMKYLHRDGRMNLDEQDEIVKGILTTRDGNVVHSGAREAMGL